MPTCPKGKKKVVPKAKDPAAYTGTSFAGLPDAALASILAHVPQQQRLSSCALVCCTWAAAAASVPVQRSCTLIDRGHLSQLQTWLAGSGAEQLTSLRVSAWGGSRLLALRLPCHRLQQLYTLVVGELRIDSLQFSSSSGGVSTRSSSRRAITAGVSNASVDSSSSSSSRPACVLPSLRELHLVDTSMLKQLLLQVAQLTGLTKLSLDGVRVCSRRRWAPLDTAQSPAALAQLLSSLPGFADLTISCCSGTAQIISPVSAMQRLQKLRLELVDDFPAAALAAAPVSLTALELSHKVGGVCSITADAQLSRLTNLQWLDVYNVEMHPAVLDGMTWLQRLSLDSSEPWEQSDQAMLSRVDSLLTVVGCLTQLQDLNLQDSFSSLQDWQQQQLLLGQPPPDDGIGYQRFSALTASSQLTSLLIRGVDCLPVPSTAAVDHIFPPGRVLPHLKILHLEREWSTEQPELFCVGAPQVARIAASCPALEQLDLRNVTPQDFDRACLEPLLDRMLVVVKPD